MLTVIADAQRAISLQDLLEIVAWCTECDTAGHHSCRQHLPACGTLEGRRKALPPLLSGEPSLERGDDGSVGQTLWGLGMSVIFLLSWPCMH